MMIYWTRDSVCMGDDCTAPNARTEVDDSPVTVSDLLDRAADYVPHMSGSVWVVWVEDILAGFLEMSTSGYLLHSEPVLEGTLFPKLRKSFSKPQPAALHVHCAFYTMRDFCYQKGQNGPVVDQFPESSTLLDKVKCLIKSQSDYKR